MSDAKYQKRDHLPLDPPPKYVQPKGELGERAYYELFYPIATRRPASGTRGVDVTPNRAKGHH